MIQHAPWSKRAPVDSNAPRIPPGRGTATAAENANIDGFGSLLEGLGAKKLKKQWLNRLLKGARDIDPGVTRARPGRDL